MAVRHVRKVVESVQGTWDEGVWEKPRTETTEPVGSKKPDLNLKSNKGRNGFLVTVARCVRSHFRRGFDRFPAHSSHRGNLALAY